MKKFYLLAALLFLPSFTPADMGIIVQSSGTVVLKEVYSGDIAKLAAMESARQAADPSLTFTNTPLPSAAFDAVTVPGDQSLRAQIQNDKFNVLNSTNTAAQKIQSLIDFLQLRGILN